ncbi:uncharacterized protein LOC121880109 [Homarus americanus]|uniref:uncharacterized protein LOC121880109 n=1 Tax=Homarus americanus TaxID=6706 RepID=UPI001C4734F9|nr:uncharacterized protein LOC121880109 [Homarus americanus]
MLKSNDDSSYISEISDNEVIVDIYNGVEEVTNQEWGSRIHYFAMYSTPRLSLTLKLNTLWLRHTPGNLPPLLHRIQEGSNRLLQYVSKEDRELGDLVEVQCFSAGAIARAALNTSKVDFLVISTHGGEMDILSALGPTIMFRMIVVVVPLATKQEYDELDAAAKSRGLITAFNKNNCNLSCVLLLSASSDWLSGTP